MGAAWCRHRAERAHDSKSPIDRVIVRCVDKFYTVDPAATPSRIPISPANGNAGSTGSEDGNQVLVYSISGGTAAGRPLPGAATQWQKASLQVPRAEEQRPTTAVAVAVAVAAAPDRTPVPPPRRKRQMRRKMGVAARPPPPRPPVAEPPLPTGPAPPKPPHLLAPPKPRPKNLSTVSLPDYRRLETREESLAALPPRPSSASPRPSYLRPPSLTSVSEATLERVETYMRRCRSFGSMRSGELADKLSCIDTDSEDSDPWGGIDEFDHVLNTGGDGSPPLTPRSRLPAAPNAPATSTPEGAVTRGRFLVSAPDHDWFKGKGDASEGEKTLTDVKKELQSIIHDYNRTKKLSTSSTEVLPTQPVQPLRRKKISVASLTPPPSPAGSDTGDDDVIAAAPVNREPAPANGESASEHSTLLRLLRECQNLEGALEQIQAEEDEVQNTHKNAGRSCDSGLDVGGSGSLERQAKSDAAAAVPASGDSLSAPAAPRRRRDTGDNNNDNDGGSSSGRSSMTPSLSELEAALSDMLEKSAAAEENDEDRATPPPPPPILTSPTAPTASNPVPVHKPIPKISVSSENGHVATPAVH